MKPRAECNRWTPETVQALHSRWMAGEKQKDLAAGYRITSGTLSRLFIAHGLPSRVDRQVIIETRLIVKAAPVRGECRIEECKRVADHRGLCGRCYQLARRVDWIERVALAAAPGRAA